MRRVRDRGDDVHLWLSAKTGAGLDLLHAELRDLATGAGGDGAWTARARHVSALERARTHLGAAASALVERNAGELAAEELREVQRALGEITGEFSTREFIIEPEARATPGPSVQMHSAGVPFMRA